MKNSIPVSNRSLRGFRWIVDRFKSNGKKVPCLTLKTPKGKSAGTVFFNGTWWTWDEQGIGGKNLGAQFGDVTIEMAMAEVENAVVQQRFHLTRGQQ